MEYDEKKIRDVEQAINQSGYTLADLINQLGRHNSKMLMMSDEYLTKFSELLSCIEKGNLSKQDKGKKLEELSELLFRKSVENLFDIYKNCRTSTNEIDLLIRWTENARLAGINRAFPFMGDIFLCECKNYNGAVSVTYVGKFSSLMSVTNSVFGIMISWDGVTGRNKWTDAKGLIKKIALRENRYIIVLDRADLKEISEKKKSVFSLAYDKYTALKNEIDCKR